MHTGGKSLCREAREVGNIFGEQDISLRGGESEDVPVCVARQPTLGNGESFYTPRAKGPGEGGRAHLVDQQPQAPDAAVSREVRARIRSAFANLPPKYRLVATLALIENAPYEEIAAAAGITVALVKVRVFRATRMLRKQLRSLSVEIGAHS